MAGGEGEADGVGEFADAAADLEERSGGVACPRPVCTRGPRTISPSDWSSRRSRRTIPIPTPWPAMGCWSAGPRLTRLGSSRPGCAVSMDARSVRSLPSSWPGAAPNCRPRERRRCCWSGTMPPGTSAPRSVPGSARTIGRSSRRELASALSPATCRSRAPGSIPSSRSGSTPSAASSSRLDSSPQLTSSTAAAPP